MKISTILYFSFTIYLQIYNIFMLFWMVNFAVALGQMTLAGAFASYYWAWDKSKDIPAFPLASSFWRCFRYVHCRSTGVYFRKTVFKDRPH